MSEDDNLFKPLSAKVQPKGRRWSCGGREMDEKRQLASARKDGVPRRRLKRQKTKGEGDAQA